MVLSSKAEDGSCAPEELQVVRGDELEGDLPLSAQDEGRALAAGIILHRVHHLLELHAEQVCLSFATARQAAPAPTRPHLDALLQALLAREVEAPAGDVHLQHPGHKLRRAAERAFEP